MRCGAALACAVLALAAAGPAAADEALWTLLRAGGQVIMLRHAGTDGTPGDPPGARFGDCATQRNLPRRAASRPGKSARRCARTRFPSAACSPAHGAAAWRPRSAFGRAEPLSTLLGGPRDPTSIETRVRALRPLLGAAPVGGNLVLVTHGFTILDVTGERVAEGEMAILTPQAENRFTLAGHLMAGGPPR